MRRLLKTSTLVVLALLALDGVAVSTAAGKKVSVGNYESAPNLPSGKGYDVGVFSVEKSGGKRQIVRTDAFLGIYYPDDGKCDDLDLPLAVESIPISASGRFKVIERTPAEDAFVKVKWKGRWTKPGIVKGSITIKHDDCSSTRKWAGGKVG